MIYTRYLENRMARIKVNNLAIAKKLNKIIDKNGKCYFETNLFEHKEIGPIDTLYEKFIKLGKKLYELNRDNICKISHNQVSIGALVLPLNNVYNAETQREVERWLYNNPSLIFDSNIDKHEVETRTLIDMSVFSYLVLCSLEAFYENKNVANIYFDTYTTGIGNDISKWFDTITMVINTYEINYIRPEFANSRPQLKEQTELIYNNDEVEFVRVYENIYSLFWMLLKMHIYAISSEVKYFKMCGCGNMILGKSPRCDTCKLSHNAKRKAKIRASRK